MDIKQAEMEMAAVNSCIETISNYTLNDQFQSDVEDLINNFEIAYSHVLGITEKLKDFLGDFN